MSPPAEHPVGKQPGKGGSGNPTPCPSSGASQGSLLCCGHGATAAVKLCPAPATRRDQGEQFMFSESSCPGDLNPSQRGRLMVGSPQGGAGSMGRKEALSPCVAPCHRGGPGPGTVQQPHPTAARAGCRTLAMVGAHGRHSGLRQWQWALQGISARPLICQAMVMPFAEPPGCCRAQVPSEDTSCCHGNTFLQPQICFASSLLLV